MPTKPKQIERDPDELHCLGKLARILDCHRNTVAGWAKTGLLNPHTKERIRLRKKRQRGRVVSCLRWIEEFDAALDEE